MRRNHRNKIVVIIIAVVMTLSLMLGGQPNTAKADGLLPHLLQIICRTCSGQNSQGQNNNAQ